jgi:radical SAM protein with 4Fe4S-binding SPASM domain
MISITRLLCNSIGPGDYLRYEKKESPRPVIAWNCTRQCNLNCIHCYASADNKKSPNELTTAEGEALVRDLADFGVPVILFSGGEPLMRKDLFQLIRLAKSLGIRTALSTNGTVITDDIAKQIQDIGFSEVGISLDGIGETNDHFRGKKGAFDAALTGIRKCKALDLRVSLRLTITQHNFEDIPAIMKLVEDEGIERVCFYHLSYSGRGEIIRKEDVDLSVTRAAVDEICRIALDLYSRGKEKEILTVSNHVDGVYLYQKLKKENKKHADEVYELLQINGGNNSGIKIGAIDEDGNVHPDQFWRNHTLGNVRERKFGDIWTDTSNPLMKGLKDRRGLLKGRCGKCKYVELCNGSLRARAEAVYGDIWAEDPACYLTDEEIGIA